MGKYVPGMTERQKTLITQVSDYAEQLDGYKGKLSNFDYVPDNEDQRNKFNEIKKNADEGGIGDLEIVDVKYEKVYVRDPVSGRETYVGDRKFVALKDDNGNICISCYGTDDLNDGWDDLISTIDSDSPDAVSARDFYNKVRNNNQNADISLFGHSHGAFLCAAIIKSNEDEIKSAFFYNAQMPIHDLPWHKIESVRVAGELLKEWLDWTGITDIHDRRTNKPDVISDALGLHGWNDANYGPDGYMGTETIKVDTDKLKSWSSDLNYILKRYISIVDNINNILSDPSIIKPARLFQDIDIVKKKINNSYEFLNLVADLLNQCENDVVRYSI